MLSVGKIVICRVIINNMAANMATNNDFVSVFNIDLL